VKGTLSLFKCCGNVPQPLRPNTETQTKTKILKYKIKTYFKKNKKKQKNKFFIKTIKGFVPENGEGRSSRNVRTTAKNASAQNTGLKWITMLAHP